MGIESSTSTFLKISFETAAHFLTDATMKGTTDDLTSPASRLVVGRVVEMGTGCFDLVQNLDIGDLAMQTAWLGFWLAVFWMYGCRLLRKRIFAEWTLVVQDSMQDVVFSIHYIH